MGCGIRLEHVPCDNIRLRKTSIRIHRRELVREHHWIWHTYRHIQQHIFAIWLVKTRRFAESNILTIR
jgi:hypothetical protein